MPSERLTTKQLQSLTERDIGKIVTDGGGLRGRVRRNRSGQIHVQFEYRYRGARGHRTKSVEHWPRKSLAKIRQIHRDLRTDIDKGRDPIDARIEERLQQQLEREQAIERKQRELANLAAEAAARRSFAEAVEQWAQQELIRRKDKGRNALRELHKDVLPNLGHLPVVEVTRAMLMDALDKVVARGAPVGANHLFGNVRQFFNFAVTREWVQANPLAGVKKENVGGRQRERDRYLSEDEIRELAVRLPDSGLLFAVQHAIWILLATSCRIGELCKARWSDIDLQNREWHIPAGNSKNAKAHLVYLSDFAVRHLQHLTVITGTSDWCLPNRSGAKPLDPKSVAKQIQDRVRAEPLQNRTQAAGTLLLSGGP